MESYLPTRPSSDLHRRFSTRVKQSAAIDMQHYISPGAPGRNRQRSSSFSGLAQSVSRLMPSNRPERGGTARPKDNASETSDNLTTPKSVIQMLSTRGRVGEREDSGVEMRRTQSLSPRKTPILGDLKYAKGHRPTKLKKPSTLQRLWELHRVTKLDDSITDVPQCRDWLRSGTRESQPKQTNLSVNVTGQKDNLIRSVPMSHNIPESVAALKRTQQIFEQKKARREERRSFRQSDDFIGVQGANPRTGYPDPSSCTSSSVEGALSESTRIRFDEDEKRMATASREYKAALERREKEIRRLELERDRRRLEKKERVEKKRAQLRARIRRDGRWKIDGNTWSMVTEPSLSPIVQSIVRTPKQENAPCSSSPPSNEDSITRASARLPEDDHTEETATSRTPKRHSDPQVGSTANSSPGQKRCSYHVDSTSKGSLQSCLTNIPDGGDSSYQNDLTRNSALPIRREELGSPGACRHINSSETIIHHSKVKHSLPIILPDSPGLVTAEVSPSQIPTFEVTTPGNTTHALEFASPTPSSSPFLEFLKRPSKPVELRRNGVIATSYHLSSINQAEKHRRSLQEPKDVFQETRITALEDFPPVVLKDPTSASIPTKPQSHENLPPLPVLKEAVKFSPPAPLSQARGATTSTTITTGFEGLPFRMNQLDGFKDIIENQVNHQNDTIIKNGIPTPTFRPKEMLNGMPSFESQMNQADIATSLANHCPACLTPTKRPIPRLCQQASPKVERVGEMKSIHTSTCTSLQQQSTLQQSVGAKATAQVAFLGTSTHRLGAEVKARSASLISARSGTRQVAKQLGQEKKTLSGDNVGIGDLSKSPEELSKDPQLLKERPEHAKKLGDPPGYGGEDGSVVRCKETKRRGRVYDRLLEEDQKILQRLPTKNLKGIQTSPIKKPNSPDKRARNKWLLRKSYDTAMGIVGTAWSFVSPVFNPGSKLRWRWFRNELTWQDIFLIGAAGLFGGGAFLIMVLLARFIRIGIQIVKGCIKVCKVLAEL